MSLYHNFYLCKAYIKLERADTGKNRGRLNNPQ